MIVEYNGLISLDAGDFMISYDIFCHSVLKVNICDIEFKRHYCGGEDGPYHKKDVDWLNFHRHKNVFIRILKSDVI